MPEDNANDKMQNDMAVLMLQVLENVKPAVEAANGFKKQLEENGWSPTAAETCSMELLQGVIRSLFK